MLVFARIELAVDRVFNKEVQEGVFGDIEESGSWFCQVRKRIDTGFE